MAFTTEPTRTPTSIGELVLVLKDPDGTNPNRSIFGEVTVLDQSGEVIRLWHGDVQQHLNQAQISGLVSFLDDLRAQAASELLP